MRVIEWARRSVDVVIPVALYLAAHGLGRAAGFGMTMPWLYWQVLDEHALLDHPLGSLCYLHSQPPVLNALVALVMRIAYRIGWSPERTADGVFVTLGLMATVVLYRTVRFLTGSRALAVVALVFVLADPAYHVYANVLFYEFLVHVLLVLLLAATVRYLRGGENRWLLVVSLLLATVSATRSLFHPLWTVGYWCFVAWLGSRTARPLHARVLAPFVVLVMLLVAWPAKNAIVYGRFFEASMSAFNLARGVPGCSRLDLLDTIPPGLPIAQRAMEHCGPDAAVTLTAPLKGNGMPNFNWVMHLAEAPAQEACAIAWAKQNPGEWLRRAAGQYVLSMRPSFDMGHFSGLLIGPDSSAYAWYADLWRRTLFADLRPFVERRYPHWFLHRYAVVDADSGRYVPYTLFGFVLFPAFLLILVVKAVRRRRDVGGATALVMVATMLLPVVASSLTDGLEGSRMRFSASFLVPVGICWLLSPGPVGSKERRVVDGRPG